MPPGPGRTPSRRPKVNPSPVRHRTRLRLLTPRSICRKICRLHRPRLPSRVPCRPARVLRCLPLVITNTACSRRLEIDRSSPKSDHGRPLLLAGILLRGVESASSLSSTKLPTRVGWRNEMRGSPPGREPAPFSRNWFRFPIPVWATVSTCVRMKASSSALARSTMMGNPLNTTGLLSRGTSTSVNVGMPIPLHLDPPICRMKIEWRMRRSSRSPMLVCRWASRIRR